jgi:hypothetical protein
VVAASAAGSCLHLTQCCIAWYWRQSW